jgi:hypothetical protein
MPKFRSTLVNNIIITIAPRLPQANAPAGDFVFGGVRLRQARTSVCFQTSGWISSSTFGRATHAAHRASVCLT